MTLDFRLPDSAPVELQVTAVARQARVSFKTVGELGAPLVVPSIPNSRRGPKPSSLRQGRVAMDKIIVGIDVSRDRLDVAVRPSGEAFEVERNAAGREEACRKGSAPSSSIDTSSRSRPPAASRRWPRRRIAAAGLPVVIVNPAPGARQRHVQQPARQHQPDRCLRIAHYVEATGPEPRPMPDEATRQLADLVARRLQTFDMIGAAASAAKRLRRRCPPHNEHRRGSGLGRCRSTCRPRSRATSTMPSDSTSALAPARSPCSPSVPGVGATIARPLIAELPEFGTLDRQPITALAGLCPPHAAHRASGRGSKLHRRRPTTVRTALRMRHHGGQEAQPRAQGFLRAPARGRHAQDRGPHGRGQELRTSLIAIVRVDSPWRQPAQHLAPSTRSRRSNAIAPNLRQSVGAEGMARHPLGEQ